MTRKEFCEAKESMLTDGPLVTFVNWSLKMSLLLIPPETPGLWVLFILEQNETFCNYGRTLKQYVFL